MSEHDVDHSRARLDDLEPRRARLVPHPDHGSLEPQEGLAGLQPLGHRDFPSKLEALTRVLLGATDHGKGRLKAIPAPAQDRADGRIGE
jgi:hypothetical protein